MREVVPSMKGGAVKEERSPLNEATDYQADSWVSWDMKKLASGGRCRYGLIMFW